ncbi:MAG: CoA-binding protein [Deltaproteobacteria bacterium]|nr:CoA-binding protein [Deltaproteobacteria bacterium]
MSSNNYIAQFFDPKSVAIVGSFKKGLFGGYIVVKTLLDAGYRGNIYPINPSYNGEVLGIRVYPSVISVQDSIDVAFIMIGSKSVPQVLEECGK